MSQGQCVSINYFVGWFKIDLE